MRGGPPFPGAVVARARAPGRNSARARARASPSRRLSAGPAAVAGGVPARPAGRLTVHLGRRSPAYSDPLGSPAAGTDAVHSTAGHRQRLIRAACALAAHLHFGALLAPSACTVPGAQAQEDWTCIVRVFPKPGFSFFDFLSFNRRATDRGPASAGRANRVTTCCCTRIRSPHQARVSRCTLHCNEVGRPTHLHTPTHPLTHTPTNSQARYDRNEGKQAAVLPRAHRCCAERLQHGGNLGTHCVALAFGRHSFMCAGVTEPLGVRK